MAALHFRHSNHCTSRRPGHSRHGTMLIAYLLLLISAWMPMHSEAFSISMEYRPPVKSSVSKIRMPRTFSSESSSASSFASSNSRSLSRKDAFATAYAPEDISSQPSTSSFERRMRELALGAQNKIMNQKEKEAQRPSNVHVVESLEDYKRVVGEEKNRVVAVRFHATWCRACKAVAPHFYRLASVHKDVVFVDVPVTQENAVIHQGLGVPSLPFGHIYHPQDGLVEELKLTRKDIQEFEDAMLRTKADLSNLSR